MDIAALKDGVKNKPRTVEVDLTKIFFDTEKIAMITAEGLDIKETTWVKMQ